MEEDPLDDPVLARARALCSAAQAVPVFSAAVNVRGEGERSPLRKTESQEISCESPMQAKSTTKTGNMKLREFKCSVITGSSLVNVTISGGGDIRSHVKRGMSVEIDGAEYTLSTKKGAEWSSNRVELTHDYAGETNFDATFRVYEKSLRSPKKKNLAEPIDSSAIRSAIAGLDEISTAFRREEGPPVPPVRRHKVSKTMNIHEYKTPMAEYTAAPVSRPEQHLPEPQIESYIPDEMMRVPVRHETGYYADDHSAASAQSEGGSYLSMARQNSMATQRQKAQERVLKKKQQEEMQRALKKRAEDEQKAAHKLAMEMKATKLREKTLQRVSKLKHEALNAEEAKQAAKQEALSRKLQAEAHVQAEGYKQKMLKMRQETARRLRARRQAEDERVNEEKRNMNRKLNEISEQRRRVDRELPESYLPPKHTTIVRKARTASPVETQRQRVSRYTESTDDAGFSPPPGARNAYGDTYTRSASPVVTGVPPAQQRSQYSPHSPPQAHKPATPLQWQGSSPASIPPKDSERRPDVPQRSRIPQPRQHAYATPVAADDADDLSDDSLGASPPVVNDDEFTMSSPRRIMKTGGPVHVHCDEDISVLTFDSPQRETRLAGASKKLPARTAHAEGSLKTNTHKKKKVWRALKPLQIGEYARVPKGTSVEDR